MTYLSLKMQEISWPPEELRKKGIKSPSKLLSPKYLSPASIKELNKNPSSPKRVHFVNSIVILSANNNTKEEDVLLTNACDLNLGDMVKGKEGVKEQGKEEKVETDMEVDEVIKEEESEFETNDEIEEILEEEEDDKDGGNFNLFQTIEELTHHEWLLKNPRPPWVKARIRAGSQNNIKISCMISHLFKRHAYKDLESPINIMSRRQYNQIMTYGLRSRQKSSNPNKISNFIGRIRGLKVFIGGDSCDSTHLYSNPNTDPNRMPLTKAKGQIPQKDKIHKIGINYKNDSRKRYSGSYVRNEASI
ncbi:hypothetical protein Tco_0812515 [Tanacetum coccineum]